MAQNGIFYPKSLNLLGFSDVGSLSIPIILIQFLATVNRLTEILQFSTVVLHVGFHLIP